MHEAQMHTDNSFLTLTYNDDNLPHRQQLNHSDFQKFMKRLRKHVGVSTPISYYMGGEYGEQNWRPHFHACVFGWNPTDRKYFTRSPSGEKIYTSDTLHKIWGLGFCTIGDVTFNSAAYIARYCLKKITGDAAEQHYKRYDNEGEYQLNPEYNRMSLKNPIGKKWLEKYKNDVYNYDHIIVNGQECKPPKYYDKQLKKWDSDRLAELKEDRELNATLHKADNTPQRLEAREQFQKARIKSLKRDKL